MRSAQRVSIVFGAAVILCGACGGEDARATPASDRDARQPAADAGSAPPVPRSAIVPTPTLPPDVRASVAGLASDAALAVAVGDTASARQLLAEAARLDPENDALRAWVGPARVVTSPATLAAARAAVARVRAAQPGGVSGGEVALAAAPGIVAPLADTSRPAVALGSAAAASTATPARARATATRSTRSTRSARAAAAARRRRQAQLAAARDSMAPAADSAAPAPKARRKRTWPWTRAQRWLVAKGIGGGAGAGVVVGAIVGNVPGAILAGSAAGGAVGFKKATKIAPAAPYPTKAETAEFEQKKAERERADSAERVAQAADSARAAAAQADSARAASARVESARPDSAAGRAAAPPAVQRVPESGRDGRSSRLNR